MFYDPGLGNNGVACVDCHASVQDESVDGDGRIRAGHTLFGVAQRPYWRGDSQRRLLRNLPDTVDVCVELFMGGAPLQGRTRSDLMSYLTSLKLRRRPEALRLETALEADLNYDRPKYRGGDADLGRKLFYRTCHSCHPHGGAGVAPAIFESSLAATAMKIREGNGVLRGARRPGEWMPAYGPDRLSHRQVAHIAAFVLTLAPRKQ